LSNIRLFVTLLIVVQSAFFVADGWTAYVDRRRPRRQAFRLSVFVFLVVALYFAVQLALSSLVPDFHRLLNGLAGLLGITRAPRATAPGAPTMIVLFVAAYVAGTLFDYLVHRFILHRWMFVLHENHHLPTMVSNLMPGIAARPFVAIPNLLINGASVLVLLLLAGMTGRPALADAFERIALPLVLVFAFIACASHSSFLRRFDAVETVFRALAIVTPREHLVHHAAELEGNYGNFTMIWDRLFGTYVPPPDVPPAIGLRYDQDFLGSLTGGLVKLPPAVRAYFSVDAVCRIGLDSTAAEVQNVPHPYEQTHRDPSPGRLHGCLPSPHGSDGDLVR
jgi:sterol desaturase/sphingolipid hydroxylase (fatty acid hydroxylase superfamily)